MISKAKSFLLPVLAVALIFGYSQVAKAEDQSTGPWHQQMVEQLAAKLGVSESELDSAMTELHQQERVEHHLMMQNRLEERLQTLVQEGKLTEGQKEAWLEKHEDWQAEREAEQATHREEMEAWFAEQGIDPTVLGPMGMGMGKRMHFSGR